MYPCCDLNDPDGNGEQDDDAQAEPIKDLPEDRGEESHTVRRSERSRRAPGRLDYPELGKPLISFAQSLLESFNHALNSFSDYQSHEVITI